jgi:membrane protein involved in D-alanine export
MLPFSSIDFLLLMAIFIVIMVVCKKIFKASYYKYILSVINFIYLYFFFPNPIHFLSLIVFSYFVTYLLTTVINFRIKLWGILILLLPMLLVKSDIRFEFYPFELNTILSFAGLSYASFRIISYYMDKAPNEKFADFITYFNYLSFSPTILIGPIERYSKFEKSQKLGFDSITSSNFIIGWNNFVKGIAFKFVFAELIDRYWLHIFPVESKEILHMANTMYAYYFYLFFDFAGYSFMALGIGKMMGMEVPVNFTNPFLAVNPQDFWRRFHISLGDWLKDYFFTPLYMYFSRKKSLKKYPLIRQNISLFMTFLLMGCWNGFKLNFILSGSIFGIYSVVHNTYVLQCKKKGKDIFFGTLNLNLIKYFSIFIVFNLIAIALYVFSGKCPLL